MFLKMGIHIDVELKEEIPPQYLFHGTGEKYVQLIDNMGLLPKKNYMFIFQRMLIQRLTLVQDMATL